MRLKSFRIFRYKSIIDSGVCSLSPDFTVFIGKNESGKTAILEALRDFDREHQGISSGAVSINGMHGNPELALNFDLSPATLDAILKEAEISIPDDIRQNVLTGGISLRKSYEGEYRLSDRVFDSLFNETSEPGSAPAENDPDSAARRQRLSQILDVHQIPDLKLGHDVQALQDSITDLRRLVKSRLNFIRDEAEKVEAVEILHAMTNSVSPKSKPVTARGKFMSALVKRLPRFIYFSDFKDVLPFEVSIEGLKANQTVCDFARLAQLDLDAVMSTQDVQRRINLLSRASATITGAFFDHWEQDHIELIARPEGNKILFGVKEHSGTDLFKMEQRSRGFQWFLSFYLRINRYQDDNVVLLIDEPGMNLHPTAQKNILTVMEKRSSPSMQILFSTHSPALIDVKHLERVRCVVKSKLSGSVIIKGISDAVDQETLMPVSMASGAQSVEKLKSLFSGEVNYKESLPAQEPVAPAVEITPAQATKLYTSSTMPPELESGELDQLLQAEKIMKEKAAKRALEEEEEETPARKPFFKFLGR